MGDRIKIIKGNFIYTPQLGTFAAAKDQYCILEDGIIKALLPYVPDMYQGIGISDYGDKMIIPGFVDLHSHAPQFVNRGIGLDLELLPWLETYTFPEEAKYSNLSYAQHVYEKVVQELWKQGTTSVVLFGTIHKESDLKLMELLSESGLNAYVGKVNMDRNSPDALLEKTADSLRETEDFIRETATLYKKVKPILTPRFVPTCTSQLMEGLHALAETYNVPVQSHLSENRAEVEWVRQLYPEIRSYASVYHHFGLFGQTPTIMAHCVYNTDAELELIREMGVYAAHCPISNVNLSSGIAPVRKMLRSGIRVGLGADVSGGHDSSMAKVIVSAIQVSKLNWITHDDEESLSLAEAFFLATKGGGRFFGKVGSFEKGYVFDALVIDDASLAAEDSNHRSLEERLNRYIYLGSSENIVERYAAGEKLAEPHCFKD